MKVLIIDNYDSFTFNLYQYVGEILAAKSKNFTLEVLRNDAITINEIKKNKYERIIISPGPGSPIEPKYFGVCSEVLKSISKAIPTLGVCLGMQGMAFCYGGKIVQAKVPMHGKTSTIKHDGNGVFTDMPQGIEVMRYHSLIVEKESLPECLEITASTNDTGEIMGLKHKQYPIVGVQFHPESFATDGGKLMLSNFLLAGN